MLSRFKLHNCKIVIYIEKYQIKTIYKFTRLFLIIWAELINFFSKVRNLLPWPTYVIMTMNRSLLISLDWIEFDRV